MIVCCMTVVIDPASHCTLTAESMTTCTSLTYSLLVSFVCNLDIIVLLTGDGQDAIRFVGRQ